MHGVNRIKNNGTNSASDPAAPDGAGCSASESVRSFTALKMAIVSEYVRWRLLLMASNCEGNKPLAWQSVTDLGLEKSEFAGAFNFRQKWRSGLKLPMNLMIRRYCYPQSVWWNCQLLHWDNGLSRGLTGLETPFLSVIKAHATATPVIGAQSNEAK